MANYTYETHDMPNPLLPFIFHRDTVVSQTTFLPNWHENIELLCCVEGEGWVKHDQGATPFCAGDIVVVNSEMLHGVGSSERVRYHCLIIDRKFWESNGIPVSTLHFQTRIQGVALFDQFQRIVAAFDNGGNGDIFAVAQIRYAVLGIMGMLCQSYLQPDDQLQQSVAGLRVKQAMSYIRSHVNQPITLDDIAAHVGISKFYMAREFKNSTGMTVIEAVNAVRCTQAKRLIEEGMRVSAAAQSCGFENMSYFSRTFKKQFGVLPSACCGREKVEIP